MKKWALRGEGARWPLDGRERAVAARAVEKARAAAEWAPWELEPEARLLSRLAAAAVKTRVKPRAARRWA